MPTKKKTTPKSGSRTKKPVVGTAVRKLSAPRVAVVQPEPTRSFEQLRKWNLALAAVYALQGIALLLLSVSKLLPVSTSFSATDPLQTAAQGHTVSVLASQHLFDINLAAMLGLLLFVLALVHALVATKLRNTYESDVAKGQNRVRWIAAMFTGGLALVIVAMLAGVQELGLLLAIFGLNVVMNLAELQFERRAANGGLLGMVIAKFAGLLPWILIALYLIFGGIYGNALPAYVYWIFGTMYVCFAALAAVIWLHYKARGRWADNLYAERIYLVLGVVTVSLLTWQVFAGALRP